MTAHSSCPDAAPDAAAAAVWAACLAVVVVVLLSAAAAAADQAVLGGPPRTHAWSLELLLWGLHSHDLMSAATSASLQGCLLLQCQLLLLLLMESVLGPLKGGLAPGHAASCCCASHVPAFIHK
jgi:hypothetical protein